MPVYVTRFQAGDNMAEFRLDFLRVNGHDREAGYRTLRANPTPEEVNDTMDWLVSKYPDEYQYLDTGRLELDTVKRPWFEVIARGRT